MKKKDIEKALKAEIEQNVPNVLDKVLSTPVTVEEVIEKENHKKPYFQFRYLYLSLAMCAVLVIGIGFLLPSVKQNSMSRPDIAIEDYTVVTNITVGDYTANIISNKLDSVNVVIVRHGEETIEIPQSATMLDALTNVVRYLKNANAFEDISQIVLNVSASNAEYSTTCYNSISQILDDVLTSFELNVDIAK